MSALTSGEVRASDEVLQESLFHFEGVDELKSSWREGLRACRGHGGAIELSFEHSNPALTKPAAQAEDKADSPEPLDDGVTTRSFLGTQRRHGHSVGQEVPMPKFRFETVEFGKTTTLEEELASADLASQRAIELAHAVLVASDLNGADHSGSSTKVYDEAGYLVATVNFSDVLEGSSELQPAISDPPTEEPGVMRSG
ncbi:hypothetical protein NKI56_30095 [Mesorhizobium sp. M0622]|uniref:hypothetical protein n=1 Tax=unclassified Mesorhizobium TaxID=325217 RepID=UPI003338EEB5